MTGSSTHITVHACPVHYPSSVVSALTRGDHTRNTPRLLWVAGRVFARSPRWQPLDGTSTAVRRALQNGVLTAAAHTLRVIRVIRVPQGDTTVTRITLSSMLFVWLAHCSRGTLPLPSPTKPTHARRRVSNEPPWYNTGRHSFGTRTIVRGESTGAADATAGTATVAPPPLSSRRVRRLLSSGLRWGRRNVVDAEHCGRFSNGFLLKANVPFSASSGDNARGSTITNV